MEKLGKRLRHRKFCENSWPIDKSWHMQKHIQIISTFIWGNNARMKSFDLFLSKKFLLCHNFDEGPKDRQTEKQKRTNRNTKCKIKYDGLPWDNGTPKWSQ